MVGIILPKPADAETSARPNIVLVFIDDMGWADLSCFGNEEAETPNVDALASEGIAFEQFYVNSSICSPSRVAISTGTYSQRWSISSFLSYRGANKRRNMANWLDPAAPLLARSLQQAGYATGHFGKWHMGGQRDASMAPAPTEYGFDQALTNFEGVGPKLLPKFETPDGKVGRLWEEAEKLGGPVTWMQRSRITSGYVDAAITFMDAASELNRPFYVNLWPDDVHSPFFPPLDQWEKDGKSRYLAVLEAMDAQLARLFDYIKTNERLRENTLIIVCSDNGPEKGAGDTGPFRGLKGQLLEGGIRSPLIVWGPGLVETSASGSRNTDSVFSAIDLVPSLVRLADAEPPAEANYDGEELLDTLVGKTKASRQKPLFFSRAPRAKATKQPSSEPDLAVRHLKWKLLCAFDGSRPELYDVVADPGESTNLAESHPEVVETLANQAIEWHASMPQEP
ncbi:MAG: sulfatase-like hydrolase/transferase, partial [Chthoniobacterales bacterium]